MDALDESLLENADDEDLMEVTSAGPLPPRGSEVGDVQGLPLAHLGWVAARVTQSHDACLDYYSFFEHCGVCIGLSGIWVTPTAAYNRSERRYIVLVRLSRYIDRAIRQSPAQTQYQILSVLQERAMETRNRDSQIVDNFVSWVLRNESEEHTVLLKQRWRTPLQLKRPLGRTEYTEEDVAVCIQQMEGAGLNTKFPWDAFLFPSTGIAEGKSLGSAFLNPMLSVVLAYSALLNASQTPNTVPSEDRQDNLHAAFDLLPSNSTEPTPLRPVTTGSIVYIAYLTRYALRTDPTETLASHDGWYSALLRRLRRGPYNKDMSEILSQWNNYIFPLDEEDIIDERQMWEHYLDVTPDTLEIEEPPRHKVLIKALLPVDY